MRFPEWRILEDGPGVLETGSSCQAGSQDGDTRDSCGGLARDTSPRGLARTGLFRIGNGGRMC